MVYHIPFRPQGGRQPPVTVASFVKRVQFPEAADDRLMLVGLVQKSFVVVIGAAGHRCHFQQDWQPVFRLQCLDGQDFQSAD